MYVLWKSYSVHVTLTDLAGKEVLDVTGKCMKCCGDWNDPDKQKSISMPELQKYLVTLKVKCDYLSISNIFQLHQSFFMKLCSAPFNIVW